VPHSLSPYIVGLTGGIGSGKSAAAAAFARLGAEVVDTDAIAHELTAPGGAAMPAIRKEFGDEVVAANGALDRAVMRRMAFSDGQIRSRLEAILHPMIRIAADRRCASSLSPYVVLVVPLLLESGNYRQRVHRLLVVDVSESTQVARVVGRSAMKENDVRAIMATQASRAERLAAADDVIDNEGDLAALRQQVEALHRRYLAHAGAR